MKTRKEASGRSLWETGQERDDGEVMEIFDAAYAQQVEYGDQEIRRRWSAC